MSFEGSSLWRVRQKVGQRPAALARVDGAGGGRRTDGSSSGFDATTASGRCPGAAPRKAGASPRRRSTSCGKRSGLEADAADLVAFACVSEPADHLIRYPNGDLTHYFGIWFVLRRWRGEPKADGDELVELGWFSRDALPEPLMHSSAVALRHYAAYLETGIFQIG